MDYRRQIRLVLFSAVVQGVYYLRLILLVPILTRCLGTELYGIWGKMFSGISLLGPLIALGTMESALRLLPAADLEKRGKIVGTLLRIVLIATVAGLVVMALAAPGVRYLLHPESVHALSLPLLLAFWLTIPLADASWLCTVYYQLTQRPRQYGKSVCLQAVVQIASALGLWHVLGQSLWVPVLAFVLGPLVLAIVVLPGLLRETGWHPDRTTLRDMLAYGLPLVPATLLFWVSQCADRYMMAFLLPQNAEAQVGIYTANYTVGGLVQMLFAPFLVFYLPEVYRLWERAAYEDAEHLTRQSVKYALICCVPLLFAAPFLADVGMSWIAGKTFCAAPEVMFLVIGGNILYFLGLFAAIPLQGEKRTVRVFVIYLLSAVVNIALNAWLIPQVDVSYGGMIGAALATVVSFGMYLLLMRFAAGTRAPFRLGIGMILRIVLCAVLGAALGYQCQTHWGVAMPLAVVLSLLVYGCGLFLLRVIQRSEMQAVTASIRGLLGKREEKEEG